MGQQKSGSLAAKQQKLLSTGKDVWRDCGAVSDKRKSETRDWKEQEAGQLQGSGWEE